MKKAVTFYNSNSYSMRFLKITIMLQRVAEVSFEYLTHVLKD